MDNLINQRLDGRYLIEQLVGSGGMANVYKGHDTQTGRTVAIKVLREEFLENTDLVRRFKNESKAISVLDHPNIVKVYDVNMTGNLQYIVMEYIDGITLKEYMEYRAQPLTYKETLHFVTQVLLALHHAHEKGIVYRDVKPQNIIDVYKRQLYEHYTASGETPALSPAQQKAFAQLASFMDDENPHAALLHGVTSSGKTLVFLKLIEKAIAQGKQALVLVPEISLTPQMIYRLKTAFGSRVAVQHSALSNTCLLYTSRCV